MSIFYLVTQVDTSIVFTIAKKDRMTFILICVTKWKAFYISTNVDKL